MSWLDNPTRNIGPPVMCQNRMALTNPIIVVQPKTNTSLRGTLVWLKTTGDEHQPGTHFQRQTPIQGSLRRAPTLNKVIHPRMNTNPRSTPPWVMPNRDEHQSRHLAKAEHQSKALWSEHQPWPRKWPGTNTNPRSTNQGQTPIQGSRLHKSTNRGWSPIQGGNTTAVNDHGQSPIQVHRVMLQPQ